MPHQMRHELGAILDSWRALSPVAISLPLATRTLLERRYSATVARNTAFSLALLGIVLVGFGGRAPVGLTSGIWLCTAALYAWREALRRRRVRLLEAGVEAGRVSFWELFPGLSAAVWSLTPMLLQSWVSPFELLCMVSACLGVIAMIAVSYVPALPACFAFLATNGTLLVVSLVMQQTYQHSLLAALAAVTVVTLLARVVGLHRTLIQAITAEQANALLVAELQSHRDRLTSENDRLGLSLIKAAYAAERDALTGLYNRRYVDELVLTLQEKVASRAETISLCLIDIDYFKRINDRFGHAAGDEILQSLSKLLEGRLREGDVVARMGGEEFLAVLRTCRASRARRVAESVRLMVAEQPWPTTTGDLEVTVSVGVVEWAPHETFKQSLQRADEALYEAKGAGRNRVMGGAFEPTTTSPNSLH